MGIFDWLFGKKSKDSEVKYVSKKREDIKLKVNNSCNLKRAVGRRWSMGEMKCCICGNTQVALPSTLPLEQAIANRLEGQNIGAYPFSRTSPPNVSLRSCIPMYCRDCGHVICLECVSANNLNEFCPECGEGLQYLTISVLQRRGIYHQEGY